MGRAKSSLDRPWNPGTTKGRFDSIVTGPGWTVSLLFDNPARFQKWPEDGNISGYAHFLSSRENRRFYTKCSFIFWIFLFFEEKYKAFFVISREAKKQVIFYVEMTSSSIVPHLTYILLIVSIGGRLEKSQNDRFSKGKWAVRNRPAIVPEIQGRARDDAVEARSLLENRSFSRSLRSSPIRHYK